MQGRWVTSAGIWKHIDLPAPVACARAAPVSSDGAPQPALPCYLTHHDHQVVVPVQHAAYDVLLAGAERAEAPVRAQCAVQARRPHVRLLRRRAEQPGASAQAVTVRPGSARPGKAGSVACLRCTLRMPAHQPQMRFKEEGARYGSHAGPSFRNWPCATFERLWLPRRPPWCSWVCCVGSSLAPQQACFVRCACSFRLLLAH